MQTIYWTVCTLALEGKREMLLQEQEYQQEKQTPQKVAVLSDDRVFQIV